MSYGLSNYTKTNAPHVVPKTLKSCLSKPLHPQIPRFLHSLVKRSCSVTTLFCSGKRITQFWASIRPPPEAKEHLHECTISLGFNRDQETHVLTIPSHSPKKKTPNLKSSWYFRCPELNPKPSQSAKAEAPSHILQAEHALQACASPGVRVLVAQGGQGRSGVQALRFQGFFFCFSLGFGVSG